MIIEKRFAVLTLRTDASFAAEMNGDEFAEVMSYKDALRSAIHHIKSTEKEGGQAQLYDVQNDVVWRVHRIPTGQAGVNVFRADSGGSC